MHDFTVKAVETAFKSFCETKNYEPVITIHEDSCFGGTDLVEGQLCLHIKSESDVAIYVGITAPKNGRTRWIYNGTSDVQALFNALYLSLRV